MKIGKEEAIRIIAESELVKPVIDCLVSGHFAPGPDTPVAEGETVIGERNDLEKTLYVTFGDVKRHQEEMHQGMQHDTDLCMQNGRNENIIQAS